MAAAPYRHQVVYLPLERGSDTSVPFVCTTSTRRVPPGTPWIFWGMGWAEGDESARALADTRGVRITAVRAPTGEIARKASNVHSAFDNMAMHSLARVARKVAKGRRVMYGGNSLGGIPSLVAAANNDCDGWVGVSPAGLHNLELGKHPVVRAARLAGRLVFVTGAQNIFTGDFTVLHAVRGGRSEIKEIGAQKLSPSVNYVVSNSTHRLMTDSLQAVNESGMPAALFAPRDDAVFPDGGYKRTLATIGCEDMLHSVAGPHATMEGRHGLAQRLEVVSWLSSSAIGSQALAAA